VVTQGTASEALHADEMMPAHAPARHLWRSSAIVGLKLVHSAIFLVNSAAILHIFVAGIRDRPSRWTGPALALALAESTVFVANRGRCPLTTVAEALGAESGRVSDIFLPRWCADRIPQLCAPPIARRRACPRLQQLAARGVPLGTRPASVTVHLESDRPVWSRAPTPRPMRRGALHRLR